MLISRLGDWLIFEGRWDKLAADWRAAPPTKRLVLTDGRPAVVNADNTVVTTIPMPVWETIRFRLKRTEDFHRLDETRRSREKLCEMCATPLAVSREFAHAWTFVCPRCRSTEIHGKNLVGGTHGAGETEKA